MRVRAIVAVVVLMGCEPEATPSTGGGASAPSGRRPVELPALWGSPVVPLGGGRAAIADPESDSVYVVTGSARTRVQFPIGSRPARVVAAGNDLGVVLRGTGQLARLVRPPSHVTVPPESLVPACTEPRGIAYDAATDALVVACATGELVTVGPNGRTTVETGLELRDVLIVGGKRWVTTFRSAELLAVDAEGSVTAELAPPTRPVGAVTFKPSVAWRAVADGERIVMVHQLDVVEEVTKLTNPGPGAPYYGQPYCSASVVTSALTVFDTKTATVAWSAPIVGAVPLDVAAENGRIAVAFAGLGRVLEYSVGTTPALSFGGCLEPSTVPTAAVAAVAPVTPVGVGYVDGELEWFDQSGVLRQFDHTTGETSDTALVSTRTLDVGRRIFHAQSPSGVACASCHPEGFDDGHTWQFGAAKVRSQSLEGGLLATAPYHWDGRLRGVKDVLEETFVLRMGGAMPDVSEVDAVEGWLNTLPARGVGTHDRYAAKRGAAIFASAQCATCHAGAELTNAATVDVGTGKAYQVPSLKALRWRGPWMHDGCAKTLEQRFDPACGGAKHGAAVAAEDVPDLVEYLKTL